MPIATSYQAGGAVVRVDGRLDAEWALTLSDALEDLLRAGVRRVVVDLARTSYVSSAGARVLLRSARDFAALRGELLVAAPPPVVADTLAAAGLERQLIRSSDEGERRGRASGALADARVTRAWRAPATPVTSGSYETSPHEAGAALALRVHRAAAGGDPVVVGARAFGLGVGAIGADGDGVEGRAGELVGAAGAVVYLPTDGAHVPDYLVTLAGRAPCAALLSGLTGDGGFSHLVRFDGVRAGEPVPLSEVAGVCLDSAGADAAGLVLVAEVAELVGASRWRPPPAAASEAARFEPDAVREWLAFTAEPAYARSTALVVGVVARRPAPPLAAHLRPLGAGASPAALHGHFHAAVFSYRPVPRRTIALGEVVETLLERETLRTVLHLLSDRRRAGPARESRFVRGLAWASPVATVGTGPP